jgi:hypothetical protein
MSILNDGDYWRERAQHIRSQADTMPESWSRRVMRQLADDYDRLAERADARHLLRRRAALVRLSDD